MRMSIIGIFLLLMLAVQAGAAEPVLRDWSRGDVQREAAFLLAGAVDCYVTHQVADSGAFRDGRAKEHNPVLGRAPSAEAVRNGCVLAGLSHALIADLLAPVWRARFQKITLVLELGAVAMSVGAAARVDVAW